MNYLSKFDIPSTEMSWLDTRNWSFCYDLRKHTLTMLIVYIVLNGFTDFSAFSKDC